MIQAIGIMAAIGVGAAAVIFFFIIIPLFVYTLPYGVWLGWHQGENNIPRKPPSDKLPAGKHLRHTAKNATKLYRSWITHKPHNITDW